MTDTGNLPGKDAHNPLIAPADFTRGDCSIRHITPADYDWIFERLWMDPQNLMTYRFNGLPPQPEQMREHLWKGVSAQFLITRARRPQERHGLVTFYNVNHQARHAGVAVAFTEEARGIGWPMVGAGIAIEHWFRSTPCNKLWAEVPEWNEPMLRRLDLFGFEREGCQQEHEWLDGRFWNRYLYGLLRDRWAERRHLWNRGNESTEAERA